MDHESAIKKSIISKPISKYDEYRKSHSFNFLGIVLRWNLKWNKHTDPISKKISIAIGVMYRLKQIYPRAVLLTLYQAIIYPHFIYGYWYGVLKLRMVIHCIYFKRRHWGLLQIKIILLFLNLFAKHWI